MAYTKQTWACGDEITAEKLNHMEDGISQSGGTGTVVIASASTEGLCTIFDKTWQEVADALNNGQRCVYMIPIEDTNISGVAAAVITTAAHITNEETENEVYNVLGIVVDPNRYTANVVTITAPEANAYLRFCQSPS